jgi:type VI secretion system secreted protein VgrG
MLNEYVWVGLDSPEFSCEHVQIHEMAGKEAISQLFSFDLEIVVSEGELDLAQVMGADASLVFTLQPSGREIRRLHGMIAAVDQRLDPSASFRTYHLTLVPRAFRLTLVETQEIFLDKSVPEIFKEKLERVGLGADDVELRLSGSYPARPFVVQYAETDLAFISRLAEHLGISFSFEHAEGHDKLIFSDRNEAFRPIEGEAAVPFHGRGEESSVFEIDAHLRLVPALYVLQDYNYQTPRLDLTTRFDLADGYAGGVVEYGTHHGTPDEGGSLAQIRAEERGATRQVYTGRSNLCRFRSGGTCALEGHPWLGAKELLLVEVEHRATQVTMMDGAVGGERTYTNRFKAIERAVPYRPRRLTPKPRISGLLFGLIEPDPAGELGKYAQIDLEGCYTVRFFFDTSPLGARLRSSLPIRMLQPHAGTNYGMHFPLKPGVEVLVAFVEGDPDRPFIVGAVPNPITPSPVARPNAILNRIESAIGVFIEMKDV